MTVNISVQTDANIYAPQSDRESFSFPLRCKENQPTNKISIVLVPCPYKSMAWWHSQTVVIIK